MFLHAQYSIYIVITWYDACHGPRGRAAAGQALRPGRGAGQRQRPARGSDNVTTSLAELECITGLHAMDWSL